MKTNKAELALTYIPFTSGAIVIVIADATPLYDAGSPGNRDYNDLVSQTISPPSNNAIQLPMLTLKGEKVHDDNVRHGYDTPNQT